MTTPTPTTLQTCPYPRCEKSAFAGGLPLTSRVKACRDCGSLAWKCPETACRAWNRPFARFCRQCGRELPVHGDAWDESRTADLDDAPPDFGPAEVIADLSELSAPSSMGNRRIALSAVQGFLAVHQAGGFFALVRPFAGRAKNESEIKGLAYSQREPEPSGPADPAFDPVLFSRGRYLLLSSRQGLAVVDLWDTDISADYPSGQPPRRFSRDLELAAAPILLGEGKIGLVLGRGPTYSWLIWDFADTNVPHAPMPLPRIEGSHCEVSLVSGKILTFATPQGHWVWHAHDAIARRAAEIKRTWPTDPLVAGPLVEIDERVKNPGNFEKSGEVGQVFLPDESSDSFFWHFRTEDKVARSYRVRIADLSTDDRVEHEYALPIGTARQPGRARLSVIFAKGNKLYEEGQVRGQPPNPCAGSLSGEGAGMRLHGSLITTINKREGSGLGGSRSITVQPIWSSHPQAIAKGIVELASDPLIWSRWLFTVENDKGRLALVRRALLRPSSVTGSTPFEAMS